MYIGQDEGHVWRVTMSSGTNRSTSRSLAASAGKKASSDSCKLLLDGKEDGHATQIAQAPTNVSAPVAAKFMAEIDDMMGNACPSWVQTSGVSTLHPGDYGYDEEGNPTYLLSPSLASVWEQKVLGTQASWVIAKSGAHCSSTAFRMSGKQNSRCHMPPMQQLSFYCTQLQAQEACM